MGGTCILAGKGDRAGKEVTTPGKDGGRVGGTDPFFVKAPSIEELRSWPDRWRMDEDDGEVKE